MNVFEETEEELDNCNNIQNFNLKDEIHLAKVVKCYDGDTIHCIFKHDGRYQLFKVRMYGYDTAEMRPSKKLPEDIRIETKKKALEAKKRLQELILNKHVIMNCMGFGKYGRLLATVKLKIDDEKTVNDIMIEEGYGKKYYGGKKN